MKKKNNQTPFLVFKIAEKLAAIELSRVITLIDCEKLIPVPFKHKLLAGKLIINDYHLPIVEIKSRLGFSFSEKRIGKCAVVLKFEFDNEFTEVGVLVDEVEEIIEMNKNKIQPIKNGSSLNLYRILNGIIKYKKEPVSLINPEKLFYHHELKLFSQITNFESLFPNNKKEKSNSKIKPTVTEKKYQNGGGIKMVEIA